MGARELIFLTEGHELFLRTKVNMAMPEDIHNGISFSNMIRGIAWSSEEKNFIVRVSLRLSAVN